MFSRETVCHCPACDELTPHSRQLVAVPVLLALVSLSAAGWCIYRGAGSAESLALGAALLWVAVFLVRFDRERFWQVPCLRCRGHRLAELGKTKPTLDGRTETHPW